MKNDVELLKLWMKANKIGVAQLAKRLNITRGAVYAQLNRGDITNTFAEKLRLADINYTESIISIQHLDNKKEASTDLTQVDFLTNLIKEKDKIINQQQMLIDKLVGNVKETKEVSAKIGFSKHHPTSILSSEFP
jgi:predicted DNA-binding protein YlxM (UPF0122 family)